MKCLTKKMATAIMMVVLSIMMVIPAHAAGKIKINKTSSTLSAGETVQLKISGTKKKPTWKSTNKEVATVSSKGLVKAKSKGSAKIKASVDGKKYTCTIKVKASGSEKKGIVKKGTVTDHNVTYTFKYNSNKDLEIIISNKSPYDIKLGWTNDFQVQYVTSKGTYFAGLDVLGSLQRTSDLNFNVIHAGETKSYIANLKNLKGTLKAVVFKNINPLKDVLPIFDWGIFGYVTYEVQVSLR